MGTKKVINGIFIAVFFCTIIAGLNGCGGNQATQQTSIQPTSIQPTSAMASEFDGAPDWVIKGCSAYFKQKQGTTGICGVGSIGGTTNPSIARTTAVSRARTEIARSLQTQVMSMMKDYQSTTTGGQEFGKTAADEQRIQDVSKQITDVSLSGTEHVDSWVSKNGTYYALVVYDVDKFKEAISGMQNLSDSVKKAVIQRADQAFTELDNEIAKQRASK